MQAAAKKFEDDGITIPGVLQFGRDIAKWVEGKLANPNGVTGSRECCIKASGLNSKTKTELPCDVPNDAQVKVNALLSHFDVDKDGHLLHKELASLWLASMGQSLSVDQYMAACRATNADPAVGISAEALASLYAKHG